MPAQISGDRLQARLEELSTVGRTPDGGVSRFSYSPEHAAAVRLVARWMREAGAEPAVDAWGNLFALVPGEAGTLPPIASGSHLDTVPNGGIFDGALGVLGAVEAAAALRDAGTRPRHPLLLLGFAEEEGTSYGVGCLGSLGAVGRAPAPEALHDAGGRSAADALRAFDTGLPRRTLPLPMAAYVELHIEQGPTLAARETPLAAVDAIVGISRLTLEFVGEANHAGTTPMDAAPRRAVGGRRSGVRGALAGAGHRGPGGGHRRAPGGVARRGERGPGPRRARGRAPKLRRPAARDAPRTRGR